MISRATLIASATVAALALAAPAHADGFGLSTFMIGTGGASWVPQCKAPQVLTELKDSRGQSHFVCVAKPAATTAMRAPAAQGEVRSAAR